MLRACAKEESNLLVSLYDLSSCQIIKCIDRVGPSPTRCTLCDLSHAISLRVSGVNGLVEPYPENTTQRTKQIPGDHNASRTSTRAFSLMNRECSGIARRLREGPGSTSKSNRCELA